MADISALYRCLSGLSLFSLFFLLLPSRSYYIFVYGTLISSESISKMIHPHTLHHPSNPPLHFTPPPGKIHQGARNNSRLAHPPFPPSVSCFFFHTLELVRYLS